MLFGNKIADYFFNFYQEVIPVLFIFSFACGDNAPTHGPLLIESPITRTIFQRNIENLALVSVEGAWLLDESYITSVYARFKDSEKKTFVGPWKKLEYANGRFKSDLWVPAGGWYTVEIRAFFNNDNNYFTASVEKIGVGEVFITAGQSNAASFGSKRYTPLGLVSAWNDSDEMWQRADDPQPVIDNSWGGSGGSPWSRLGDLLNSSLGVPIGFIGCGQGSSLIEEWLPTSKKKYYERFKIALEVAGSNGVRAILWHQGESDASAGTSSEEYSDRLTTIINQLRSDAGRKLPFGVAKASHLEKNDKSSEAEIRQGQLWVIDAVEDVFEGPDTDSLGVEYRTEGQAHFTDDGLWLHAEGWEKAIQEAFFI